MLGGHSACISFPAHTPALCGRVTTIQPELPLPTEIRQTQQAEGRDHIALNSTQRCPLTQTHESRQHRAEALLAAGGEKKNDGADGTFFFFFLFLSSTFFLALAHLS